MKKRNKEYIELFLDNFDVKEKKVKNKIYFTKEHELAIIKFNNPTTSEREKNNLFNDYIDQGFKDISDNVLNMPKFHKLPKGIIREQLMEEIYYRLIQTISCFTPDRIGKNGVPVKAFSLFSTIAKNYALEKILRFRKILKNKADVEGAIDLSILSEDNLKMVSNYDKTNIIFNNNEFEQTKKIISSF